MEAAITPLCTAGALEIELDLRELTFIDSPQFPRETVSRSPGRSRASVRDRLAQLPGAAHVALGRL
jgi:hypothetical protein